MHKPKVIAIAGILVIAVLLMLSAYKGKQAETVPSRSLIDTVYVSNIPYKVFVAENYAEQVEGLMNYTNLSADGIAGEIFVNVPSPSCFWMKNTPEPLTQAWIEGNTVSFVYNATPYSTNSICSRGTTVLELMKGIEINRNQTVRIIV